MYRSSSSWEMWSMGERWGKLVKTSVHLFALLSSVAIVWYKEDGGLRGLGVEYKLVKLKIFLDIKWICYVDKYMRQELTYYLVFIIYKAALCTRAYKILEGAIPALSWSCDLLSYRSISPLIATFFKSIVHTYFHFFTIDPIPQLAIIRLFSFTSSLR